MSVKKVKISELPPLPGDAKKDEVFLIGSDSGDNKSYRVPISSFDDSDTIAEINGTVAEINGTVAEINGTMAEINGTVAEINGTLGETLFSYGVRINTTTSSPDLIRVGNMDLHRSLPVQSKMRGCLLDDDGNVVKYLNANDWSKETLDGSSGQVMVEIPEHYTILKPNDDQTGYEVRISDRPIPGYDRVPLMYVSAYEAALDRETGSLVSVKNMDARFRGGNNDDSLDGTSISLLGCPVTAMTLDEFRTAARKMRNDNPAWNCYTYAAHRAIYWLFVIEYATLNSQKPFVAEKDINGFSQGGLGDGVTDIDINWDTLNIQRPFIRCGITASSGNSTANYLYTVKSIDGATSNDYVPKYRGIENPFGHIHKITDGLYRKGISVSLITDPRHYGILDTEHLIPTTIATFSFNSFITKMSTKRSIMDNTPYPHVIPLSYTGGSSNTFFCDGFYNNQNSDVYYMAMFGGSSITFDRSGLAMLDMTKKVNVASNSYGTRLCFHPANA